MPAKHLPYAVASTAHADVGGTVRSSAWAACISCYLRRCRPNTIDHHLPLGISRAENDIHRGGDMRGSRKRNIIATAIA